MNPAVHFPAFPNEKSDTYMLGSEMHYVGL